MPLTFLHGPIGSGKTCGLLERLSAAGYRRGIFVVPNEATARELAKRVLTATGGAIIGRPFLSWESFVRTLADVRRPLLTSTGASLLVLKIMSSHSFRYFRMRRPSVGLARQFAHTIIELKRNGVDPSNLRQILETRGTAKENDLLTLYDQYESERLKLDVLDEGDLTHLAIENIHAGRAAILKDINTIIFDEFPKTRPGQRLIIREIRQLLPRADIIVSLPVASDCDAIYKKYLEEGLATIEEMADRTVTCRGKKRKAPHIEVFSMRSPLQEARAATAIICSCLTDEGHGDGIVLASHRMSPFLDYFTHEAIRAGLVDGTATTHTLSRTAILHEILSPRQVDSWPEEASIDEFATMIASCTHKLAEIKSWCDELGRHKPRRERIARSLSSLASLDEVLNRLCVSSRLVGLEKVRRETFTRLVIGEIPAGSLTIRKLDRTLPFRHLPFDCGLSIPAACAIIPEMAEGIVPATQTERPFFTEVDRLSPSPEGTIDEIFPPPEDALVLQAYLFDTFLEKCDRLILTYSIIDESGSELSPSPFLDAHPVALAYNTVSPFAPPPSAKDKKLQDRLAAIEIARTVGGQAYPEHRGLITSPKASKLVRERFTRGTLSPTRLERYASCPFAFFVEKVLGLIKKDEETPEFVPKDRGTIVHAVLERFYRDNLGEFRKVAVGKKSEDHLKDIIEGVIDQVLGDHPDIIRRLAPSLVPSQRKAIQTMAWQVVRMEIAQAREVSHPLWPYAFEWGFGTDAKDALTISIDGDNPALIGGRIDRIDTDEGNSRFVIVDYKTGRRVESVKGDILKGLHLQLPLYTEAARRFLFPDAIVLGGLLIAVQIAEKRHGFVRSEFDRIHYTVGRSHSAMDDREWDRALATAISFAASYVAAIRDGRFEACPTHGCPRHCDYSDVCRYYGR